jgi:hypothetical protein
MVMQLPWGLSLSQMQTKWASIINPFLANKSLQSNILSGVRLVAGLNVVNTGLGRALIGWRIIRIDAASTIYDEQSQNTTPSLTLLLNSSAPCVVSLEVF